MSPESARRIAEVALRGAYEPGGVAELAHVRRVASAVLPEARSVAWLHESIERSSLTLTGLAVAGCSTAEAGAVRLLTREDVEGSDDAYLAHLTAISRAPGRSGFLARAVKAADLNDRIRYPRRRTSGWAPPYAEALHMLETGARPR